MASTASSLTPTCVSATVDPQTLAIGSAIEASCDDPRVFGETVGVVNGYIPHDNATISISSRNPETGQVTVGPVVMTCVFGSTSRPVVAYSGGWLWIYDNSVIQGSEGINTSNPGVAELLQVSTSNGQVVNSVSMPGLSKPLMAANDEGLWIGNSIFGGVSPGALYFVASGSNTPEVMISTKTVVCWLTGNQNVLWLGISASVPNGCQGEMILRLDGTDPQPILNVPFQGPEGYQMNTVIGDESQGLWTVSPQGVVSIDPDTGAETVVATLSAADLVPERRCSSTGRCISLSPRPSRTSVTAAWFG